jgi:hypothetical protein
MCDAARAAIVTTIIATGRQIPVPLENTATQLLEDLWTAGLRYDVQPADWRVTTSLPTDCLDVLILVERRRSTP